MERQRIALLGSTGSIGVQTLDIVRENSDLFEITTLTAHRNWERLAQQAIEFNVDSVVIADKTYMLVEHKDGRKMMEVVAQNGENNAFRLDYVDFDAAMQSSGGAYGSSSNSSATRNLSSLDLGGMNNPKHGLLLQEKNDGKSLVVRSRYYLRIGKFDIEANKKAVEQIVPAEKEEEWKQFLKKNKIKWKKPESLLQVLEFFK